VALDPSTFLPTSTPNAAQAAGAQQLSDLATPQQIQAMYDYAKALRTSSTDTPVHAWTQGVSNVVKALMGGVEENRAANAERGVMGAQANAIPGGDGASAPGDLPGFGTIDSNRPRISGGDQPSDTALASVESGGDDNAKNPLSSATGRYQFTDGTWKDVMQRHPDLGLTPDGRTDPAQQEKAKAAYDSDNAKVLSTAGYQPDQGNLRLAMRFGANGATKVLGADPSAPMGSIEPPNVMAINPDLGNATAGGIRQRYASLGAPNLPPDAQAMTKALNPNVQVAQNGPMPGGMSQQGFDPQGMSQQGFDPQSMINQMARRLIMTGIPPQQALATATEYVGNNLKLMPQYTTDPYGREMMVQPGHPPQLTGRQLGPGQSGTFMGLPTETTLGPNAEPHMRVITPESGTPSGAAPGPQGAAPAPGNVGAAEPAGAPPAPVAANATPPSATPPVEVAGPVPPGTKVPEPAAAANAPPPPAAIANVLPPMPSGPNVKPEDWLDWDAQRKAAAAGMLKSAETSSEEGNKLRAKVIDTDMEQANKSYETRGTLALLNDAYKNGGDNISGGPWGNFILQGKQFLNQMGIGGDWDDFQKGLNASQVISKLNATLATQMVKELTSRGTQMELALGMKNNPGLLMSNQGAQYMLNILDQIQDQKEKWGQLASQFDPGDRNYLQAKQRFYDTHRLVSPFTGKPLVNAADWQADMEQLPANANLTQGTAPPGMNIPTPPPPAPGSYTYDPKTKLFNPKAPQVPTSQ
jgi:hypothetical protein